MDLALTGDFTFLDAAVKNKPYRSGMRMKDVPSIYKLFVEKVERQYDIQYTKNQFAAIRGRQ